MNQNQHDAERFEEELGKLMSVEKLETGVYILGGNLRQVQDSRNPLALLPFCIKDPNCAHRREVECDFSLSSCENDQTKIICEILQEKHIPPYFVNGFGDVQKAVDRFYAEKGQSLDLCIAICCPRDLIEVKNEVHAYVTRYNAPLVTFFVTNYEGCKIDGKSSREFEGQTKVNIEQLRRVLNQYF